VLFSPVFVNTEPRSTAAHPRPFVSRRFTSAGFFPTDHCLVTFPDPVEVTAHHCLKSFNCNIYGSPRKCCKQKTYGQAKPFRCNTYKNTGGGLEIPTRSGRFNVCFRPIFFPFTFLRTLWHGEKLNSFILKQFCTLYPKTPGVGGAHPLGQCGQGVSHPR